GWRRGGRGGAPARGVGGLGGQGVGGGAARRFGRQRPRVPYRQVDRERTDGNRESERERGAARASGGSGGRLSLAQVGGEARLDLLARFVALIGREGARLHVGVELAQLIAVDRGVDRVARFGGARRAARR